MLGVAILLKRGPLTLECAIPTGEDRGAVLGETVKSSWRSRNTGNSKHFDSSTDAQIAPL
jgi:hypothetical protein